ncbi:MAG: hypothetical protein QM774_09830 [Gordonia sp. (in: high G+C Gram-positive bacteria)]|uniref:hypothetical protein n=1 Tax=Gordonia sp. (in: high G+C Gram-positive bacteria) TaxID=84139 RepID=UPI0039E33526
MTVPGHPAWLDAFDVPADAAGAVLALDFGDSGLWAARLDPAMNVEATTAEPRITPYVIDVRTATYLRDTGAVPEASDPAVFAELVDIVRRARESLIERDSVLLMGTQQLRLTTVSLDAVMAATVPEVNRVHGMVVELAGSEPVAAVLLSPGADQWPGLWESMTERGYTMLLPGDPFPVTFAGDDEPTHTLLDRVEASTGSLAWEVSDAEGTEAGDDAAPSGSRSRRGRVLAGVAALGLVVAGGAGVALAVQGGDEHQRPTAQTATPSTSANAHEEEQRPPATAAPEDISAARASMSRYVPPAPKSTARPTQTEAPTGPKPAPRPRPNPRRTIPNPIPGLPPIVIG